MVNTPRRGRSGRRGTKGRRGGKKAGGSRTLFHEELARKMVWKAFWPNKAPACERCARNKHRCPTCKQIETRRVYYTHGGRKRHFDFDIVLKVPGPRDTWRIVAAFEIDGPSHFKPIKFGNKRSDITDQRLRDKLKRRYCKKNKILLVRVPCYFKRDGAWVPDVAHFKSLLQAEICRVHRKIRSGALGGAARLRLARAST